MALKIISDYLQSKVRDIKFYEGTFLAREAKEELREYLDTLKQNEPLFHALKEQNKNLVEDVQKMFQQSRSRSRGIEIW